ncbi:hypothetical protein BGZ63DRAFT_358472 [Mariannaea sp. PMI_226]|nr:hypothetical protein BGZ63DRAFT_358472 [Mariannaea sp. PMI_226]
MPPQRRAPPIVFTRTTTTTRTTHHTTRTTRRNERSAQTQTESPIIDLTTEPDSPVQERRSIPNRHHHHHHHQHHQQHSQSSNASSRNPRRTNSQRISPPRLSRSDSTFFASSTGVIDLTADSPEQTRPSDSTRSRTGATASASARQNRDDELIELEFISSVPVSQETAGAVPQLAYGLTRRFAGLIGAGFLGFPQPQLDISRTAFARVATPRPPMEQVPAAREGFTRNTCADPNDESESIVVCPACNEELAYDPTPAAPTTPTGSKKRKRAPGEHHFWALKKCGHVYCADCFEHRRPKKTSSRGTGFRSPGGTDSPSELRCAVDGCDTRVGPKGEWVGIFL